ncbi:MAG: glycosyltransferase, partial [Deinococcus-Thermus bacterium]|nr:glycosyltransferase [Deinococcota bacterium]
LGTEDPGVWSFLARGTRPDPTALQAMATMAGGHGSLAFARGALVGVAEGDGGARRLAFHTALGLVTDQVVERLPTARRVSEWPITRPKAVALTFDDGPDPRFTPEILDILAAKDAKASFFLLGRNALGAGRLTRRLLAEGHDIGNHTYVHLDTARATTWRNRLELNATQRVIESQTGVRTKLFRPPYAHHGYGFLEVAPTLVEAVTQSGYLFAGYDVDSLDYATPDPEEIRRRVVNGVLAGGRVVLMHDAAGDRRPTVAALPGIIDDLQAAGFRFVTMHELVGLAREDVMPTRPETDYGETAASGLRTLMFAVSTGFATHFPTLAITAAGLGILRLLAVIVLAFGRRGPRWSPATRAAPDSGDRSPEAATGAAALPSFTVLVPAFNEEKVIANTVWSLLDSTACDRIRILVVDDGSKDRTAAVVAETFADDPRVDVLTKPNGGKADALNAGLRHADSEVVVCIDGDTVLDRVTLERIVAPFADPRVGAVAGKVVVGNRHNLLTRFQALEYAVAQNLDRHAFERFNAIGVVPGAIGAWRRRAVLEVGGYATDTLAEDADLTVALQRRGWRVVAENTAIARTEAPERLRPLIKQRFRWTFGTLQVAFKHRGAWCHRPTGVACITLPNIFVFQFAFTLLAPLMDLLLVVTVTSALVAWATGASAAIPTDLGILASFWLAFQAFDVSASAAGVVRDPDRSLWRLVPLVVVQRFTYRQLLYWVALKALLAALKGTLVGWGKLARTGSVRLELQPRAAGAQGTCLGDRP